MNPEQRRVEYWKASTNPLERMGERRAYVVYFKEADHSNDIPATVTPVGMSQETPRPSQNHYVHLDNTEQAWNEMLSELDQINSGFERKVVQVE